MSTRFVHFHLHPGILLPTLFFFLLLCVDFVPTEQFMFKYVDFNNQTVRVSNNECQDPVKKICLVGNVEEFVGYEESVVLSFGENSENANESKRGAVFHSDSIPFRKKQTNQTASFTSKFSFDFNDYGRLSFFMSGYPLQPSSRYLDLEHASSSFITVDLDKQSELQIQLGLHLNSTEWAENETFTLDMCHPRGDCLVEVDYDSVNFNLSVFIHNANSPVITVKYSLFSHIIDLSTILPENVTIGFISTENNSYGITLISWIFSSAFPKIKEGPPVDDDFMPKEEIAFEYLNFQNQTGKESENECSDPERKICLYGDAINENGGIDINYLDIDTWGAAVYSEPVRFRNKQTNQTASFTSEFTFTIHRYDGFSGVLAFFMSDFPFHPSSGYFSFENKSRGFITVDVDNEFNGDIGHEMDSNEFQLGLQLNSSERAENKIISIDESSYSYSERVVIHYDSVNFNLSISFGTYSFSRIIDLSTILPENVNVGFISTSNNYIWAAELIITTWNFSSTFPVIKDGKTNRSKWLAGAVVICMLSLICLLCLTLFFWKRKMKNQAEEEDTDTEEDWILDAEFESEQDGPKKLSYRELEKATDNFNPKRKLGEGGFGPVYSGFFKYNNLHVAIKRISGHSKQGKKEYIAEVKIFSQLRHKNMVRLIGWCHANDQLLLVYELMENGSLDSFIFDHQKSLSWSRRYTISKGLASSLIYLHEEWKQCVVHRDVKAGNVMLDRSFDAKLGDFGLARLSKHGGGAKTTFMAGTMGYMAPECFITGKGSKESDVYAFGIVALEIVCGRKCIDDYADGSEVRLVEWVWKMYGCGSLLEVADERILNDEEYNEQEVKQLLMVGLCCAHPDLKKRPSMSHALAILNFQGSVPAIPNEMPQIGITTASQQSNISYTTETTHNSTTSFMGTVELSNIR